MKPSSTSVHHTHDHNSTDVFGFWLYILTDCVLFATLFATYAVLRHSTFGGPGLKPFISLPYVLAETLLLLASSFTFGLSTLSLYKKKMSSGVFWLIATFLLGFSFVAMEVNEFFHMCSEGHCWYSSGAMSAFFTLVGTHGLHVTIGLIWMILLTLQWIRFGHTDTMFRRLTYLGLFWSFLDIVWIFVFTIVYLMGLI